MFSFTYLYGIAGWSAKCVRYELRALKFQIQFVTSLYNLFLTLCKTKTILKAQKQIHDNNMTFSRTNQASDS